MDNPSKLCTVDVYPSREGQIYDWPICEAVKHVRNVIADDDEANCYPATRIAIRQAAAGGGIFIFGRQELPPPKRPGWHRDIYTLIEPEYWQSNALDPLATDEEWQTHDHTWPEPLVVDGYRERYWSLLVNRNELIRMFPASPRPSHDACVEWCRDWIRSGRGDGENKAWLAFKVDEAHAGQSRDNVFRPAWREAKTKSD